MKFSFLLLTSILLISCDPAPKLITIDNPTDQSVTVKFEQMEAITIQPNETKKINFIHKTEKISVNNGEPVEIKFDPKKEYLINPTKSEYYIWKVPYFLAVTGEKAYQKQYGEPTTEIDGIIIPGDFTVLPKSLVIEKQWDYAIDQDPKPKLKFESIPAEKYYIVKKIISKKEIINYVLLDLF